MSQLIDVARGAFTRLPPGPRRSLGRMLRLLPTSLQYGGTYRRWRERIAEVRHDTAYLGRYRDEARIALVRSALAAPFYRELFGKTFGAGFDPADVIREETWQSIPVLQGSVVHTQPEQLCAVPPGQLDLTSTGGSSGQPVKFYVDANRSPIEIAFVHDVWSRVGYRTGDARAVFRGFDIDETGEKSYDFDPGLNELRCSVFRLTDAVMAGFRDQIERRRIRFLQGYPSAMAIFASYLLRSGQGPMTGIAGILPMSEPMREPYRDLLAQAFPNAGLALFYGLTEKIAFAAGDMAWPECYRFDPLYGYTELLDDRDRPVTEPGREGRIISTGLIFRGMPLIRYDTGDTARLVEAPTRENGWRLAVGKILPKQGNEWLVGKSGVLVSLIGALQISKEMNAIREFMFVQERPGEVVLLVAPLDGVPPDFSDYRAAFERKAAGELTLRVDVVDAIPTTMRGKRKFIHQKLDISQASRDAKLDYDLATLEPAG